MPEPTTSPKAAPKISVIIPCYNQGRYVEEAIDSVLAQTVKDFEIIVVNDGSTDETTCQVLAGLAKPRTTVHHTANQGLSAARNHAIQHASGRYILPLDADDRIAPTYLEKAAAVLDARPDVGIVYCKAELFGARTGRWDLPPYKFPEILVQPQIFATAMFRRSDWETVGGYCSEMIYGWEDYDFWLSLIELGRQVHQLPTVEFFYRRNTESMVEQIDTQKSSYSFRKLFERHQQLYLDNIGTLFGSLLLGESKQELRRLKKALDRVDRIENSLEIRIGRTISKPLRMLRNCVNHVKIRFGRKVKNSHDDA